MKRFFAVLITVILTLTVAGGVVACSKKSVKDHEHVWDEGTTTKEATCFEEGVLTYKCTVKGCTQTKTAPIGMIEHSWGEGVVTTIPDCDSTGVMTYTCTRVGCGHTREEVLPKTEHTYDEGTVTKYADFLTEGEIEYNCTNCDDKKVLPISAHTDFSENFGKENSAWACGYASYFNKEEVAVIFEEIENAEEGVYKTEDVEISGNHVTAEQNAVVVIAYTFSKNLPMQTEANIVVAFKGDESDSVFKAYVIYGQTITELNSDGASEWVYESENAFLVAGEDVLYVVFEKEGGIKAGGEFSVVISPECVHIWDEGKIAKYPSCTEEGEKVYTCVSCKETYSTSIEKTDHRFDDGVVTVKPTTTSVGEMTYTCLDCHTTKTEVIPQKESAIFLGANYKNDFTLAEQGRWQYGFTTDFNFGDNTFTFNNLSANDFAWVDSENGIELKSDWIRNERGGANAVIRYVMPKTNLVNLTINFVGTNDATRMAIRLHVLKEDGTVALCDFINAGQSNSSWIYSGTLNVEENSIISVIFFNESDGYNHGSFAMDIQRVVNYYDDFSTDGDNNWIYGYATDYNFDNNTFTFNALNANAEYGEWSGEEGVIIKKDWILSEGGKVAAIGYVAEKEGKFDVFVSFNHAHDSAKDGESPTRFAIRLLVIGSDNTVKFFDYLYENQPDWEKTCTVDLSEGDVLYALMFREAEGWEQGIVQISLTEVTGESQPEKREVANFYDDFSTDGDNNWIYGYATDYNFDNNTFTFNTLTANAEYGEWSGEEGVIIKKDWILSEGGKVAAVGYTVEEGQFDVSVSFNYAPDSANDGESPTRFAIRILVVGEDGNTKSAEYLYENQPAWEKTCEIQTANGDTVYALMFREAEGWEQGTLQVIINRK